MYLLILACHMYFLQYIFQTLLGKFCLWVLMIAINVSVAMWQLPIGHFCTFGKRSNMYLFVRNERIMIILRECDG